MQLQQQMCIEPVLDMLKSTQNQHCWNRFEAFQASESHSHIMCTGKRQTKNMLWKKLCAHQSKLNSMFPLCFTALDLYFISRVEVLSSGTVER